MLERDGARVEGRGFERVLDAEKAADAELGRARAGAGEILQIARGKERAIAARADRRLQALHGAMQDAIRNEQRRMVQAFNAEKRDLATPPADETIAAAAARLARRLAGIDTS